jgi:hypothetical protein
VFMQPGQLYSRPAQIVDYHLAVGGGSCNVRAVIAMRPLHVMDVQCIPRSGSIMTVMVEDGSANVGFLGAGRSVDANGLKDVSASYDCMGAFATDVDGSDFGTASDLEA